MHFLPPPSKFLIRRPSSYHFVKSSSSPFLFPKRSFHQIGDLEKLGLGSWSSPSGIVQSCLEHLHVSAGLPWWAAVGGIALFTRLAIVPLTVKSMRLAHAMSKIHPQARSLTERIQSAHALRQQKEATKLNEELQILYQEHGVNPLGQILFSLAPAPLFFINFIALRDLAAANIPSISESGGTLWFSNLSIPDPYFILPALSSLTILGSFEISRRLAIVPTQTPPSQLWLFRALCVAGFPFILNLPSMLTFYFVATNTLTVLQTLAFSRPLVQRLLKLPNSIGIKHQHQQQFALETSNFKAVPFKPEAVDLQQEFEKSVKYKSTG